jgi:hypothetical protein
VTLSLFDAGEPAMRRTAELSPCGQYRHELTRVWDPMLPVLLWILTNPSDADAARDDPTSREVVFHSDRLGFGGAAIVNVADFRTPHPRELPLERSGAVSGRADEYIRRWLAIAGHELSHRYAIIGFGNPPRRAWWAQRVAEIVAMATDAGVELRAFGTTKAGHPTHPLARGHHRIPRDMVPVAWSARG